MSKTNPFAGLLAGFRGARAEENHDDDEARKARRAEEDQQREEEDARRAEEDERRQEEDARRAEEDGTPADDKDGKKGQRAEDDEDQNSEEDAADEDLDDSEMDENARKAFRHGLAIGRSRESTRASRIFLAAAKIGRADLAATLAFTTRNSSAEASRILAASGAAPSGQRRSIDARMADIKLPNPGPGNARKSGPASEVDEFVQIAASAREKAGLA